ncbi:MAG: tetratricopeptide repeat protein [Candidatus Omnitrophica bacterium]|nr:tetratricopeptide repeat protein [Candidatus Omnitrophota bacterium]
MKYVIIVFIILAAQISAPAVHAESAYSSVRKGNQLYSEGKFTESFEQYSQAKQSDAEDPKIDFNMGSASYQDQKYEQAERFFGSIPPGSKELATASKYNYGNALFMQGRLKEAESAFEAVVRMNPDDKDAKYNLEYTRKRMEEMSKESEQTKNKARQKKEEQQRNQKQSSGQDEEKRESGQKTQEQSHDSQNSASDRSQSEEKNETGPSGDSGKNADDEQKDTQPQDSEKSDENGQDGEKNPNNGTQNSDEDAGDESRGEEGSKQSTGSKNYDPGKINKEDAENYLDSFAEGSDHLLSSDRDSKSKSIGYYIEKDW